MVMEAMRLSLLEHEAQQRRQQEEEAKTAAKPSAKKKGKQTAKYGEHPSLLRTVILSAQRTE